jgi:hypothetical protein
MTDSTSSSQLWPDDLIGRAITIIMNRFHLDAAQALEVLRRMSQNTRTQMCVIAEQVIEHNVPVEALRGLEEDVLLGTLRAPHGRQGESDGPTSPPDAARPASSAGCDGPV